MRLLTAAVIALAACDHSPTTTGDPRLQGTWRSDEHSSPIAGGPKDSYGQLTFGADGSYRQEYLNFGGYGRAVSELTSFTRVDGQYRLVGDELEIRVLRETVWDVQFPESNESHIVAGTWQGAGSVEISGDRLIHHYLSYALDAPVPTVQTYTRVNE